VKGRVFDPSLEVWGDQGLWVPSSLSGAYRPLPGRGLLGLLKADGRVGPSVPFTRRPTSPGESEAVLPCRVGVVSDQRGYGRR
jgi:hypothetical protein